MRGRLAFALLPLVLSLLCLPAWAGTVREEDFGVSEVERSAAEQGQHPFLPRTRCFLRTLYPWPQCRFRPLRYCQSFPIPQASAHPLP